MKIGDFVKIRREGERFWVQITELGPEITGIVDNDLVMTERHGLALGDAVSFPKNQVLDHLQA